MYPLARERLPGIQQHLNKELLHAVCHRQPTHFQLLTGATQSQCPHLICLVSGEPPKAHELKAQEVDGGL